MLPLYMRRLRNVRRVARWIQSAMGVEPQPSSWRITEAQVLSTKSGSVQNQPGTEICYTYNAGCKLRSGLCWIPFPDEATAQAYGASRPPGSKVLIRYHPLAPAESTMLERDQPNYNPLAVRMQDGQHVGRR